MYEIRCPVNGVAYECRYVAELVTGLVCFFAHESVVWVLGGEGGGDEGFDGAVGFGYEVDSYTKGTR